MASLTGNAWYAGVINDGDAVEMLLPRPPGNQNQVNCVENEGF